MNVPRFEDLPVFEKTGEHHAWSVWGEGDQVGTMNFVTAEHVRRAAGIWNRSTLLAYAAYVNDRIEIN